MKDFFIFGLINESFEFRACKKRKAQLDGNVFLHFVKQKFTM